MHFPPIIERELRVALRKTDTHKARIHASFVGMGFCIAFMIANAVGAVSFARQLQAWLFCVGVYYAVVRTFSLTAGIFVQERQEQTLGFLFLAGMSVGEIFVTKVLGAFLIAATNLLALVPFMAMPFLSGGVPFAVFWATVWCLPNLLLLALALSTLTSVFCNDESGALTSAQLLVVLLIVATPAMHWLGLYGGFKMSKAWLLCSPAYGPWLIFKGKVYGSLTEFWQNSLVTLCWSCFCFGLAAVILRLSWRRQKESGSVSSWQDRVGRWLNGDAGWRRRRAQWLERNAFVWLASYDRRPERYAWIVLGCIVLMWMTGWAMLGKVMLTSAVLFIIATLVNVALSSLAVYAAAKRIGDDRRTNALELLLTTPLEPIEIVNGQLEALRSQFRAVSRTAAMIWLGMAVIGLVSRAWNWRAFIIYGLIWLWLIAWALSSSYRSSLGAFYAALITGRPGWSVWRSSGLHSYWWIWFAFNARNIFSGVGTGFPSGSVTEFLTFVFIVPFIALLVIAIRRVDPKSNPYSASNLAGNWLVQEFRTVAASAIPESNDPRFKNWRVNQRFPIETNASGK